MRKPGTAIARRFWGLTMFILFGLAALGSASTSYYYFHYRTVVMYVALSILGLWMWLSGRRRKKINKILPDYIKRMNAEPDCTIESLASSMGRTPAATREGLLWLYRRRCFPGAYEDKTRACIVFGGNPNLLLSLDPGRQRELDRQAASARSAAEAPADKGVAGAAATDAGGTGTVLCPGCGAINHLKAGGTGECEYCGTAIEGRG